MSIRHYAVTALLLFLLAISAGAQTGQQKSSANFLKPSAERGFFKPFGGAFVSSSAAFWVGTFADIASSKGLLENNPLARNSQGGLSTGKALALNGVAYGLTLLIEKRHPKLASIMRFGWGGAHAGAALANQREKHR